jgi:hypothetical protein
MPSRRRSLPVLVVDSPHDPRRLAPPRLDRDRGYRYITADGVLQISYVSGRTVYDFP